MNINNTWVAINGSIELFVRHYKYGYNYEDSTILVDPSFNIIAFYDRWTSNIDVIQSELNHSGWFIVANWKGIEVDWKIKYIPYNREIARRKYWVELNRLKQKWLLEELRKLKEEIIEEIKEYNINYFKNLIWN